MEWSSHCRMLVWNVLASQALGDPTQSLFLSDKVISESKFSDRDRIYEKVWGDEYLGDSRTVDLHIQRMRKKLGLEKRLVAVYKVGYRLEV